MRALRSLGVGAWMVGIGLGAAGLRAQDSQPAPVAPYTRVVEEEGGDAIRLEMSAREFASQKPDGPRVFLLGAVHIGDKAFYQSLQEFLDRQDVVLFEGVKPAGSGDAEHGLPMDDEGRAKTTSQRIRFVAAAVEMYRGKHKALPASTADLVEQSDNRIKSLLPGALNDGWSRPLVYEQRKPSPDGADASPFRDFDLFSLGSDGQAGGDGPAADIHYIDQKPVSAPEKGDRSEGIQSKLATATGLVFQLDAMDNTRPNWRNSDLSIDQVQSRLDKAGADGSMLFKMLDGSSFMGKFAGLLLGFVSSTAEGKAMLRVMMIEMLGHADEMMDSMPGGMGKLMGVILEDRNEVLASDIKKVVETEPNVKTIAAIYGAGHLPGVQKRLAEMGFRPVGDTWRTAMRVGSKEAGITPAQMKQTRQMISKMVEGQMKKKAK